MGYKGPESPSLKLTRVARKSAYSIFRLVMRSQAQQATLIIKTNGLDISLAQQLC